MDNSMIYFLLTAISFPFIALFDAGGAFYRAAGNSRFPMMISVLSNGLNIAGNAVLIFGFQMGVEGAALSTLFSRIFCAVVIFWNLRKPDQVIVVNHYLKIRPNFPLIGKFFLSEFHPELKTECSSLESWQSSPAYQPLERQPLLRRQ